MEKTFQSIEVSKTAMFLFQNLSDNSNDEIKKKTFKRESILNFVNFVKYNDKYYQLHDNSHRDIISFIDAYSFILQTPPKPIQSKMFLITIIRYLRLRLP